VREREVEEYGGVYRDIIINYGEIYRKFLFLEVPMQCQYGEKVKVLQSEVGKPMGSGLHAVCSRRKKLKVFTVLR
jgi:hypothetical protein